MSDQKRCRVVGMKDNGETVVITDYVSREHADRIIALLDGYSAFADLRIECDEEA